MYRLILCCAFLLGSGAAHAQADLTTPGPAGAEAAVRAYTSAVAMADWEAAGRVIDPAELVVMSEVVAFIVEMDTTEATQDLLTEDSDNVRVFARFMDTMVGMEPMMKDALTSMRFEILGSVAEGDSLVHVVGRSKTEMFGAEIDNVEVTSVRWLGDRWAVKLDEQMRGMTQAMSQMADMFEGTGDDDVLLEEDWDDEDGSDG
ncbi:MAG: hypothetical protein Rubg2KO_24310 [Rubricoccaceae bacterium]